MIPSPQSMSVKTPSFVMGIFMNLYARTQPILFQ